MQGSGAGSIVHDVSRGPRNLIVRAPCAAAAALLLAGCAATARHATPTPPTADPTALTLSAETALKRGDCRTAAESYAQAAGSGDVALARRATQVALACEHLPAAWQAAVRWRTLAPADAEANALYAAVALKLYRTADARAGIEQFWRAQSQRDAAPSTEGAPAGAGHAPPAPDRSARSMTELTALLLQQSEAPAVLSAMSGALEPGANSADTFTLLGELALAAYDGQRAERYAQQALQRAPEDLTALRILARSYVLRGESAQALATARRAKSHDPQRGGIELAEVLASLDRNEEAHHELEQLRASGAPPAEIDRRLALLAYNSGDYKEARQRFMELASSGEGNDGAALYLADIAARNGDADAALTGYRRLYDSSVALPARSRAAALLLERSSRTEALALLDDYAADHPEDELDMTLAKARLLADHGEADAGLSLLSAALERHPQHPSIEYDRAVILERSGRVQESVSTLEHLLEKRPDDPTLLNALGYTLADHSLQLAHAESLIRRALAAEPDNPAALDSLGWVRYRAGDMKGATTMLARAYTLGHDAEIAAHWGEALWVSGNRSAARGVWSSALAREPDSKALKATLQRFVPESAQ